MQEDRTTSQKLGQMSGMVELKLQNLDEATEAHARALCGAASQLPEQELKVEITHKCSLGQKAVPLPNQFAST